MKKTIYIIIIVVFLIPIGLVVLNLTQGKSAMSSPSISLPKNIGAPASPSPSPSPTLPPIDKNSNLEQEIQSLTPTDYSAQFQQIKGGLKN